MYRKRLAALIMTGCLLTTVGCSSTGSGSGPLGLGLFSGCCGHGSTGSGGGVFGRMFGSGSAPAVASAPVVGGSYAGGYGGVDCPCSHHGGEGIYHPAVLTQGITGGPVTGGPVTGGVVMGDMGMPQSFPSQPIPVTTPGLPPNMNQPFMPGPGQPPRIQPVPQAPTGFVPSAGIAPPAPWGPQH